MCHCLLMIFSIITVIFLDVCLSMQNDSYFHRKRLLTTLFHANKYDKRVRPTYDIKSPIDVYLKLNLYQISEVNTPHQYMTLYLWVLQSWRDDFLWWDPANFGDVDNIVLPEQHVWLPDMNLENSLRPNHMLNERRSGVIVRTNSSDTEKWATIFFPYPASYKFMCQMNVAMFPFDTQTCVMIFGSWNYFTEQLRFIPYSEDVFNEGYTEHNEWEVIKFTMKPTLANSDVPGRTHSYIKATVVIKRRALSYLVTLVCPTLLTTFVSLVGFFMPTSTNGQRREKMTLGINTLLTMSVLLLGISDQMPSTSSSVPLIGIFYVGMIVVTAVGTLCTTLVIHLQRMSFNEGRLSCRVISFINKIGFFVGLASPKILKKMEEDMAHLQLSDASSSSESDSEKEDEERDHYRKVFRDYLVRIRNTIKTFSKKINKRKQIDFILMEWDWMTDVIERVFLLFWICVFCIFVIVLSAVGFSFT